LLVAVIICVCLVIGLKAFAGDGFTDLESPVASDNLAVTQLESITDGNGSAKSAKAVDSDTKTYWKSSKNTDSLILTFKEELTFNTVVIRELGWNIKEFSLSYYVDTPGNEHWERFYKQDSVEDYRYCAFDPVTAKSLKFEAVSENGRFKISEIEVYNSEKKSVESFRVTDYVVTPQLAKGEVFNPESDNFLPAEYFDVVNQIHIIASAKWNNQGELVIPDGLTGDELKACVNKIREAYGERKVEIFATVFFNACDPDTVFTKQGDAVIENTVEFLLKYGFDGVSYDWEYPNKEQWKLFSDHIVKLKEALSQYDMKVSCAVCPWNFYMEKQAIEALDQIEIMSYDLFDNDGNHSSFASGAVQPVEYFDKGFKPEQINLGLPFYARPRDGSGVWVDYDDPRYTPADRFQNYSNGMWFSGTQMTMDKTAYAIEKGLGGVMIFTVTEDVDYSNDLSLLKSVKNTIDSRAAVSESKGDKNEIG
ncbi:MAG: glycosyl hydrolase family 18 protein, partial [Acutalibacteraceae bacterium]